jgi:hypothetical protein
MKKILFLGITILFFLNSKAQNSTTRYDTCQYVAQFAGEWLYVNLLDTIRICLRHKRDYSASNNHVSDKLYGWIEYKHGNTVIESTYQNKDMVLPYYADTTPDIPTSILIRPYNCWFFRNFEGSITDYNQAKEIHMVKATFNPTNTELTWSQRFSEWHGAVSGAHGMTLPRVFILKRQ